MKVLLIPALWGDFHHGLERTLSKIIDSLNARGLSPDVAVASEFDLDRVRRTFSAELRDLKLRRVPRWGLRAKSIPWLGPTLAGRLARRGFARLTAEYDLAIVQNIMIPPASQARRSVLFTEFPGDKHPGSRDWRERLASYDLLIGNSVYTSSWIERYWDRPAEVFYPSIQECEPQEKEPIILAVGRFASGGREKRQFEMVDTFRTMVDNGLEGWRLALAGHSGNPEYLDRLERGARDYPVDIHLDISGEQLRDLYGRSSLFWHATGLGADPEAEPERFEHFGIVVAEAMTAGCVPLVFGAAGPREIVDSEELCWDTFDELAAESLSLIKDTERRQRLAVRCRESAVRRFGHDAFDRSVDRLLGTA